MTTVVVTPREVAAAKLLRELNEKTGVSTPPVVAGIADARPAPRPEQR